MLCKLKSLFLDNTDVLLAGGAIVAAIEEGTHKMRKLSNPGNFFQVLRKEKEELPTTK